MAEKKSSRDSVVRFTAKFLKRFFVTTGIFAFLCLILSFTDVPYYAYYYLGVSGAELTESPGAIVLLGGGGMPSPDGLIRAYYAAEAANKFSSANVIIALPLDEQHSAHQLELMAHELIVRGVDSLRIKFEPRGFNTHSQAVNICNMYKGSKTIPSLLIVTTPEHMYRAVKTFRRAGFVHVGGSAAFEKPVDAEMVKDKENSKDTRVKSLALRYNMWSYLNYELIVAREYCAIAYYKLKGWI